MNITTKPIQSSDDRIAVETILSALDSLADSQCRSLVALCRHAGLPAIARNQKNALLALQLSGRKPLADADIGDAAAEVICSELLILADGIMSDDEIDALVKSLRGLGAECRDHGFYHWETCLDNRVDEIGCMYGHYDLAPLPHAMLAEVGAVCDAGTLTDAMRVYAKIPAECRAPVGSSDITTLASAVVQAMGMEQGRLYMAKVGLSKAEVELGMELTERLSKRTPGKRSVLDAFEKA